MRRRKYLATTGHYADQINEKNKMIHEILEGLKILENMPPVKKSG